MKVAQQAAQQHRMLQRVLQLQVAATAAGNLEITKNTADVEELQCSMLS
jgi:hypothetical protein